MMFPIAIFCNRQGHDDIGFRIMIQDIDRNLRVLVITFSDLSNFEKKCKAGIVEFVQKGLVVMHFIRVLTLVDWMDVGKDTVQEAKIVICVFEIQDGFPTSDAFWGGDVRRTGDW